MNQRLQGWKLALALLIPAMAIGAFGFGAYQLLSDDDQSVATADEDQAATPTATPQSVEPTEVPTSTALLPPTPLTVPSPVPAPVNTVVPPTPTVTPAPTPLPSQHRQGQRRRQHQTPAVVTVSCAGTLPGSVDTNQVFGPLSAVTVPADAAAGYQFVWNFGDNTTVTSSSTGKHHLWSRRYVCDLGYGYERDDRWHCLGALRQRYGREASCNFGGLLFGLIGE